MGTSKVIFNIPTKIKQAAVKRAQHEGITLTTVLTQAAQAYGEGKIAVALVETPRPVVARRLRTAIDDYKKGKNVSPQFDNAAEAITWLRSNG